MSIFWSTPNHILVKYRCPNYCHVGIRHIYLGGFCVLPYHDDVVHKLWCFMNVNFWCEQCWIMLFSVSISRITKLICQLCLENTLDNETHILLECPLCNSIRDRIVPMFQNVDLGCLKCHFQSDHRIDTNMAYLPEAINTSSNSHYTLFL